MSYLYGQFYGGRDLAGLMLFNTTKQRMSGGTAAPPCLIMDDDEIQQAEKVVDWRRSGEEIKNARIFGIDTSAQFPTAFQTYRPDQLRSFPFQIGKRAATAAAAAATKKEDSGDEKEPKTVSRKVFFNSEKPEGDYPYAECTPTNTPQSEVYLEEVRED